MTPGTYTRTREIREASRQRALDWHDANDQSCEPGCTCGRHRGQKGRIGSKCEPGCKCKRHFKTREHRERISRARRLGMARRRST